MSLQLNATKKKTKKRSYHKQIVFDSFRASAPGKVILCGEHAVVHGSRALATVIGKCTTAQFTFQNELISLRINHSQLTVSLDWRLHQLESIAKNLNPQHEIPALAFKKIEDLLPATLSNEERSSSIVFLLFFCYHFNAKCGLCCVITSELPIGAGLGSSASFAVALAAGFVHLNNTQQKNFSLKLSEKDKSRINLWAFQAERIFHNTPSGIDNTVISYGGVISYQAGTEIIRLGQISECMRLIVTDTGVTRSTSTLVKNVHELRKEFPEIVNDIVQGIDKIADTLLRAILSVQVSLKKKRQTDETLVTDTIAFNKVCSKLFFLNEGLLSSLGVSHPAIERIIAIGKEFNFQSKLTGAGGGGCVITLIPPSAEEAEISKFVHNLYKSGFTSFQTISGQNGVSLHKVELMTRSHI